MDPPVPLAVAREWHARLAGNALGRRYMAVRTRSPKQVPETIWRAAGPFGDHTNEKLGLP